MPKIRFAIALPILMLCVAIGAVRWRSFVQAHSVSYSEYGFDPTVSLIVEGVNAPAVLFSELCVEFLPVYRMNGTPSTLLGIGIEHLLFLFGVVVLWFFVGRAIDHRQEAGPSLQRHQPGNLAILLSLAQAIVGVVLFWLALIPFSNPRNSVNPLGSIAKGVLFMVWALVLIVPSGLLILGRFRRSSNSPS